MKKMLCIKCGTIDKPKKMMKGHWVIELFLILMLIIPWIFYAAWRGSTRYNVCKKCGGTEIIPLDSPIAKAFLGTDIEPAKEVEKEKTEPVDNSIDQMKMYG